MTASAPGFAHATLSTQGQRLHLGWRGPIEVHKGGRGTERAHLHSLGGSEGAYGGRSARGKVGDTEEAGWLGVRLSDTVGASDSVEGARAVEG